MENRKVIIIGAGVSGLVSSVYARHNGFDVTVFEKNYNLGGCCCGWERKGNYIDGCLHWLQGCKDDNSVLHRIWQTVGAIDENALIFPDIFMSYDYKGEIFNWYTDPAKLKAEMLRVAPEDKRAINGFFRKLKTYYDFPMPTEKPTDMFNLFELLKIGLTLAVKYTKMTIHSNKSATDYAKTFKSPILNYVFSNIIPTNYNSMSAFFMLGVLASGDGAIPVGGSQQLSERIASTARSLGANIVTNCGVKSIIIEGERAVGVVLEDGIEVRADYVISTVPINHTLDRLLDGKYKIKDFERRLHDRKTYPVYSYTLAALKVKADVTHLPHDLVVPEKVDVDTPVTCVSLRNYSYDPTLKGEDGSYVIQVCITGIDEMYEYWKAQKTAGTYRQRKKEIGEQFQAVLERTYPELKGLTEVIDVVTPLTYERYINSRHGTFQGFIETAKSRPLNAKNYMPEVANLVLSGQWMMHSGGMPTAAFTGRFAIQRICAWERVRFADGRKESLLRQLKKLFHKKAKI